MCCCLGGVVGFIVLEIFSCFHLVGLSVWPVVFSFRVGGFLLGVVFWLNVFSFDVFFVFGFGFMLVLVF